MRDSIWAVFLVEAVILLSGCGSFKATTGLSVNSSILSGALNPSSPVVSAATYTGCAAPSGSYAHTYNATPATLATILGQAGAGDQILLASGNYGPVSISTKYSDFLTIAAAPGQTPVLGFLYLNGASHVVVNGLSFLGLRSTLTFGQLINVYGSDNVVISGNSIATTTGDFPWQEESVATQATLDATIAPSDGINASQDYCMAITGNSLRNVFNGIYVGGDEIGTHGQNYLVANNKIDLFAGDAIDHSASNILIQGNLITNNVDICNLACIHNDGIQGWNWDDKLGITNENVVIDSNVIVSQTAPNLLLAGDDMHGITIYDGYWSNVSVTNNVVLTSSWTGISVSGVDGLNVINNTVLLIYLNGVNNHAGGTPYPWILVGGTTHEGGTSSNAVMRNNIAQLFDSDAGVIANDHNITLLATGSPSLQSIFKNFTTAMYESDNLAMGAFDVSLVGTAATNPAMGTGSSALMPMLNVVGQPRSTSAPNIGAY